MQANLTKHASIRCQQRAVPPVIVEWILDFGVVKHDHRGAEIRFLDKRARKRLGGTVGESVVNRLNEYLDAYVVTKGPMVITVGHRYKRFGNHQGRAAK